MLYAFPTPSTLNTSQAIAVEVTQNSNVAAARCVVSYAPADIPIGMETSTRNGR